MNYYHKSKIYVYSAKKTKLDYQMVVIYNACLIQIILFIALYSDFDAEHGR